MARNRITMHRGDSYPLQRTLKNNKTQAVIDLTGASFLLTVNKEENPTDDSNQLFQVAGVLNDDPTTGIVYFTPTVENTNNPAIKYWYDIQYTDAGGNIRTIAKGEFVITQDVTK